MNYLQLVAIRRLRSICLFIDFIDIEIIIIAKSNHIHRNGRFKRFQRSIFKRIALHYAHTV